MKELDSIVAQTQQGALSSEQHEKLKAAIHTLGHVVDLLDGERTTVQKLRELLVSSASEKTDKVLPPSADSENEPDDMAESQPSNEEGGTGKKKRKGHGRHAAAAYTGAKKIPVKHGSLEAEDPCPSCETGKVYRQATPGVLVRITGRAPLGATVYELEKLRCHLCGEVFTAMAPTGVGEQKYDAPSAAMIGLLRYGSGLPFNRLQGLQGSLGIPLPASTQWEIVAEAAKTLKPVHEELIRQAAKGDVLHNDDTSMRILELEPSGSGDDEVGPDRTGIFTSGIVSTKSEHKIALYFTGRRHAGENLARVLSERAAELDAPIQMCDGLSRNFPKDLEVIVANCLAHGRRYFVKTVDDFPDESRHVLEQLREVYRTDATAREQGLSPDQRLELHQKESGPVMAELEEWLKAKLDNREVEPNSNLGTAINYLLKRWALLTLFLRKPGAPLDNNICERALKKAILHRRNSLFYKTRNGARVGDLFHSLIHTAELAGANTLEYLTALLRHPKATELHPDQWMPWNYEQAGGDAAAGAP